MTGVTLALVALIAVALIFDFLNGFHDAANSIATVVSTRVLPPRVAVAWAAFFNFIAFLVFGLHVAKTVGSGIISPSIIDDAVIFGALFGAIVWDIVTWLLGLPTSSSHALIGGLIGAGLAKAGPSAVVADGVIKTALGIVISPAIGFILAVLLALAIAWMFIRSTPALVDGIFRRLQYISAAAYSLSHGGNDAQKTMGVIAVLLFAHHLETGGFHVPLWVVLACQAAMGLGTLFGGWRIVRTMGSRITTLRPVQGFCAETGGASAIFLATWLGVPVSTTHTITGGIVGVGTARNASAVRWRVAKDIVIAWIVTMPAAGLIAAAATFAAEGFH
ncbi:MAG: inorganic phosphate transporter [Caulobacteraceae bacterium]